MDRTHPFRVTAGQVIVDRYDMDAPACQCVQIGGKRGNQSFTFTGTHLGDPALMEDDTANDLHSVVLHVQHAPCGLPHRSIGLGKQVIQRLPGCQAFLILSCQIL